MEKNVEGGNAFVIDAKKELYNIATSFKYRNGSYFSKDDYLKILEDAIEHNVQKNDIEYIFALSWFLGKVSGIRLSPTIILSYLIYKNKIKVLDYIDDIKFIVDDVFTRPDFIANSMAYYKKINNGKSIGFINYYFKTILKEKFEQYSDVTLKKRKMKSRKIKLADLIKVLRPRPKTTEMSILYKAIIENDKIASLSVQKNTNGDIIKADSGIAVLTKSDISKDQKLEYLIKNINKLPINELIRNLTVFPVESYGKIIDRLNDSFSGVDSFRYVNPFDLVLCNNKYFSMGGSLTLRSMLDYVLYNTFVKNININSTSPVLLVDISGSMGFGYGKCDVPMIRAIKYISIILSVLINNNINFKYYDFGNTYYDRTEVIKRMGYKTPNAIAEYLIKFYREKLYSSTALVDCTRGVLRLNPECDSFFVFSDEVSWADKTKLDEYSKSIPERLYNRSFVFNVKPTKHTVFSDADKVTRISGFDGKIMFLISSMLNFDNFSDFIINLYKEKKNKYENDRV